MNCYAPQGTRENDGTCSCNPGFAGQNCQYAAAAAVDCTAYSHPSISSASFYLCAAGLAGPFCTEPAVSAEEEAQQSTYFYIAGGAVIGLEGVYLWRFHREAGLLFAAMVLFRTFDFMSDWANWAIALRSSAFIEGVPNIGMDWGTVYYAALAFNIIATPLWIKDMRLLLNDDDSGLTKYVILFEDIPQLVFAGVYVAAVLTTEQFGRNGDPCVYVGPLPVDPVVVVSLVFSGIGLLFNIHLARTGGESTGLSG